MNYRGHRSSQPRGLRGRPEDGGGGGEDGHPDPQRGYPSTWGRSAYTHKEAGTAGGGPIVLVGVGGRKGGGRGGPGSGLGGLPAGQAEQRAAG